MLITDPVTGDAARITSSGQFKTYSVQESGAAHASEDAGMAFIWSASQNLGADKNVIWLRNNSDSKELRIEYIDLSASAAATVEICVGNGNTLGGTTVTGTNMNLKSSNVSTAFASGTHTNTNVDACSGMTILTTHQLGATRKETANYKGALILGYYDEVAVNVVTDVDLTTVNILGYYHS